LPNKICAQFVIVSGALTGARLQQGAGDVSSLQERTCWVRGRTTGSQGGDGV